MSNKTILNLVHPYTYKQKDRSYIIGPIEEFEARDKKVSEFVNYALNSGVKVLCHEMFDNLIDQGMREAGMRIDQLFKFLFDERVITFNTTPAGVPIPNERPEIISSKTWSLLNQIYISERDLKQRVCEAKNLLFIGGMLECCVSNSMGVFSDNIATEGQRLFYIPELCVSYDSAHWQTIKPKLDSRGIQSISSSEAIGLF